VIDMARPSAIAKHAGRTLLVASVLPSLVFYVTLQVGGLSWAIAAALTWYYAVLVVRRLRGRPVVGAALLGAALMTSRAMLAFWTGSAFLYFLQPVAGTIATATSFAVTALAGRPLIDRLAHDLLPVPPDLSERLRRGRFFHQTSVLWAGAYAVNAVGTVWLLSYSSLSSFIVLKSLLSPLLTGSTAAMTFLLFKRWMRREGIAIAWTHRGQAAATA
jgi:hypothetical protein